MRRMSGFVRIAALLGLCCLFLAGPAATGTITIRTIGAAGRTKAAAGTVAKKGSMAQAAAKPRAAAGTAAKKGTMAQAAAKPRAAAAATAKSGVAKKPQNAGKSTASRQAVQQKIRVTTYAGDTCLFLSDVAAFYGMVFRPKGKDIQMFSRYSRISATVDSRSMIVNRAQVYLSRPIVKAKTKNGNEVYLIGSSDFHLLLEPIFRPKTIPRHKVRTVLLDPGHGGKDVGATVDKIYEKNINLQVALRLAYKLQQKGFQVLMTRASDKDVSLDKRVACADVAKADLYISLHCNSAGAKVSGVETYIATPQGDAPTGDKVISPKSCPANRFDRENAFLAYYTQRAILARTGMVDRGLRRRRFYVVRNVANCPSILVEMGFLSNPQERTALRTPSRQEQIAEALTESIMRYTGVVR